MLALLGLLLAGAEPSSQFRELYVALNLHGPD